MESRSVIVHILTIVLMSAVVSVHSGSVNINDNGNITWADLPSGANYTTPDEYDEGPSPLPAVWDMMNGWINTISPGELPYAELVGMFNGGMDLSALQELAMNYLTDVLMGFAICLVIGFLFLLIFPIVCCCFCCCRMCGNCGGKMHQKQSRTSGCKKIVFLVFLIGVTGVLGFGVACGYFTNERTGDVLNNLEGNIVGTMDDVLLFVNSTVAELRFVALEQTTWLIGEILHDFANVGDVLGGAIKDALAVNVQPAIDSMIAMVDNIQDTRDGLELMKTLNTALNTDYRDTFCDDLDTLRGAIEDAFDDDNCGTNGCDTAPSETDLVCPPRDFRPDTAGGPFPEATINIKIGLLDTLLADNPKGTAEASKATFDNIPETVSNSTKDVLDTINGTFSGFITQIEGQIEPLIGQLTGMTSGVDDIKGSITGFTGYITEYDQYRWYAMTALHAVVLLVVVFNVIGILFGMIGSCATSSPDPTKRSGLSNCGGLFLMASAGICFIFASLYMVLTTFPFLIGAPINKFVCQPLLSGEILEATIDNPNGFMGSDGYYLGSMLFQDGSINFTVTGALEQCDKGATSYSAFGLQKFLDISKYTNFDDYIDDNQFGDISDQIDLTDVEIMSADTESNLNDFKAANVGGIDWTTYEAELSTKLVKYGKNLNAYADELETWAAGAGTAQLDTIITQIRTFQTNQMAPMVAKRDNVITKLDVVKDNAAAINDSVDAAIDDGNAADAYFASGNITTVVVEQTEAYKNKILNYLDQFSTYIQDMLEKEVGKCEPIANVIDNVFNLVCRDFLDPFNALWFVNGLYVFFFMTSIIFGVKLAKYFRRMKTSDTYDDDMEMKGYQDDGYGAPFNNKVAAGPVDTFYRNSQMTISDVELQGI